MKYGCAMGNLAMEMSTQDEEFRKKIEAFFQLWVDSVAQILVEMEKNHQVYGGMDPRKCAQSIVAMIEGGLLMVSRQNIQVL